ncbi:MAG: YfiT family bacillithiol transferase [Longimicrobiales bacterium]
MEDLRYPTGRFDPTATVQPDRFPALIDEIAALPDRMRQAVAGLDEQQFETSYREGGWTVRQVVHHVPDSHLNAYIRFRWTLTEDAPLIRTYDQTGWAELPDARTAPPEVSLLLLEALHDRWTRLLRSMTPGDFARKLRHPEWGEIDLEVLLRMYVWHGGHHVAHIVNLRKRQGW